MTLYTPETKSQIGISDVEKKTLLTEMRSWKEGKRNKNVHEPLLFFPENMESGELIDELRVIYNSYLKFIPLVMLWPLAEFSNTSGRILGNRILQERGMRILQVLTNFRSVRRDIQK